MPKFNPKQVEEINVVIKKIEDAIKPGFEIGACDKQSLAHLLAANKITKKPIYFSCKPEYSEPVVSYFTKEKQIAKSKFNKNLQSTIFILG